MQTAGSGPDLMSTDVIATLPVTASGHLGKPGLWVIGDRIVFAAPLIIVESEVDEAVARFARALDDTLAEVRE